MKKPAPNRDHRIARRRNKAIRRVGYPARWPDEIAREQKWSCHYCGRKMLKTPKADSLRARTLDHKDPISRGGKTVRKNLVAACFGCNQLKGSMTEQEFILKIGKRGVNPNGR